MYNSRVQHNALNMYPYYYQAQQSGYQSQQVPFQNNGQQHQMTPYDHFAKPPQPSHWNAFYQPSHGAPKQPIKQGQPWGQAPKGIMSYFQNKNGELDLDKMLNTVGQMANTYHQVSPIVKGLGSFFKGFSK